jgi:catechol 2,3-dioxygenase-like lactoylglutathione lyase family enzyme
MLANKDVAANIAVKDLARAQKFYAGTLGLKEAGREGEEVIAYRSGNSTVLVYRSDFAGTNKATCMTWVVGDEVDKIRALRHAGLEARGRRACGPRDEGRVVQGPRRQYPEYRERLRRSAPSRPMPKSSAWRRRLAILCANVGQRAR